jgi:hypothetical protein
VSDVAVEVPAMSQAEYARHRSTTRQAVNNLVRDGKIPVLPNGKIDPVVADRALGETKVRIDEPREEAAGGGFASQESAGLTRARTATEVYRARLAQIEFDERVGALRKVEDVRQATAKVAGALMRELELIPTMADDLAAAFARGGVDALRTALKVKRDEILRGLVASMEALAAGSIGANQ